MVVCQPRRAVPSDLRVTEPGMSPQPRGEMGSIPGTDTSYGIGGSIQRPMHLICNDRVVFQTDSGNVLLAEASRGVKSP